MAPLAGERDKAALGELRQMLARCGAQHPGDGGEFGSCQRAAAHESAKHIRATGIADQRGNFGHIQTGGNGSLVSGRRGVPTV